MKTKRSRNITNFKSAFKDKLSGHQIFKSSSEEITPALIKLKEQFNVPQYAWSWAWGYYDAIKDGWYRTHLVYCHTWKGQNLGLKWEAMPEELRVALRASEKVPTGHYWKNDDGTFTKQF